MMFKNKIRKHFPLILNLGVGTSFFNYFKTFVRYSSVSNEDNKDKLVGRIIADYHVIEKGLTMAETRLGFGVPRLLGLIELCKKFIVKYGREDEQLNHAIGVVLEYKEFHEQNGFSISSSLLEKMNELFLLHTDVKVTKQKEFTKESYFEKSDSSFALFSNTRLSARNYSEEDIPLELIKQAIDISKNTPSSCNRQTVRAHVFTDKEKISKILEIQGGNRGFGHLSNKLIILTSDLATRHGVYEMSGPYVDGGFYAMNLLYALHHYKIGACPLNCNFSPKKDKLLRKICEIPKNEVFVVMISCGLLPEKFKIPYSKRYSVENIMKIH